MNARRRQRDSSAATVAPESELAGRRERAADLRLRAAAVREEISGQERALQDRRAADEAGALDAQARELDLEQDRIDHAAELRRQADEAEAAAADLDAKIAQLDAEIIDAVLRAARFADQSTTELGARRRELQERATEAAQAGAPDALLEPERELALLPTVEQKLREQADQANSRATETNTRAAHLESIADHHCRRAVLLRRRAEADPVGPVTGTVNDPEYLSADHVDRWGGRRSVDFSAARRAALRAVQEMPDLHRQERAELAAAFERERCAAIQRGRVSKWAAPLNDIAALVASVREAATMLARPTDGSLEWYDALDPAHQRRAALAAERRRLGEAVSAYEEQVCGWAVYEVRPWPGQGQLPACRHLAASVDFRFLPDVVDASTSASDEIAAERHALTAAAGSGLL